MGENIDILKENNLRQMVTEYEHEQQTVYEKRAKDMQCRHNSMKEAALQELEDIREKQILETEPENCAPDHFQLLISQYTEHVYSNAMANLVKKYATVYDAKNIDKYPSATPLPRMQDIMIAYPWRTYERLRALAAHCDKWRQK